MSEKMYPIPFSSLMNWIVTEYAASGDIFGVHKAYHAGGKTLPIFGERIETPFGPAAGPNSQLAQNIIAAYFAGARFFEVKTVQKMDGAELAACVPRPCILAMDEGYNQEWSTELTVPQAQDEYIKAWCALKVISKVYGLGDPDGFVFNMSVGYDLEGIKGEKVNAYIDNMTDASKTPQFIECKRVLKELFPAEAGYIDGISPHVSRSVTVSTLHGCPPDEIERIASYLISEKHLHTFVKCNPTILGYKTARTILDGMGYDYIVFDEHHFNEDLQWEDAVPMFERLQALAGKCGLEFGLKLSNTFPVDTTRGELPGNEMYMSGRSLFPLTVEMCSRISRAFGGKMRISFAGGAEYFNCDKLFAAGIWPITVATTILKPGGYNRLRQMVEKVEKLPYCAFSGTYTPAISELAAAARHDFHHVKPIKPLPTRKNGEQVPWLDCFLAPCAGGCPIEQDIPEYLELCRKGLYGPALKLITEKNALPFITGTICAHRCQNKCSRNFYDESVHIRDAKLVAAAHGYESLLASIRRPERIPGKKAAIIGGGPTGIAAAYFLGRGGVETTIFEREEKLGGVPRYVIPSFRISDEAIDKDIALMEKYGVEVKCGSPAPSVAELKKQGYTHILIATGAWKAGKLDIEGNVAGVIEWMKTMKTQVKPTLSGSVVVVGAGNTAMDAARVAKRAGAHSVIVYRRTRKEMPADEHELKLAIDEGVELIELSAPVKQADGMLTCEKMKLGAPDASGRRSPEPTGETFAIPCDLVISAIGEKVDDVLMAANGIEMERKGPAFETNIEGVYCAGDAHRGPATIVEGIADAAAFAEAVIGKKHTYDIPEEAYSCRAGATAKKGVLAMASDPGCEGDRCLQCRVVCENCVDSCPNRANVVIRLSNRSHQILHVDKMCNECGNCTQFCPYASEPCHDKFTLFQTAEDMEKSKNAGVLFLDGGKARIRMIDCGKDYDLDAAETGLPPMLEEFIRTIRDKYGYLYQ
ncbi:MAG: putative selenate reductase subunit YgfK [Oscillospiraceae bacterium]|nr:putative selenate reductase subunit YgfK [Oscillospiraceae bacterium]